ncbi:DNRLRE domain-containing protein [Paenibacillus mucilaginosus]|nr:DNRLRE domain-containing protein [Paenibacillus mucilaginosus]MCG7216558.1 DNRLRE domain-containing protein [Paenibacillus mucilaginosus]
MNLRRGLLMLCLWSLMFSTFTGWAPQGGVQAAEPAASVLNDEFQSWSLTHEHSPTLTLESAGTGGFDPTRVKRSAAYKEFITYKTAEPLQSFAVYGYYHPQGKPYDHPLFYVSPNGTDYTKVTPGLIELGGYFPLIIYELEGLPAGSVYLKIEYTGGLIVRSPLIGRVVLNGPSVVVPGMPPGEVSAGSKLTLSSTAGASIFYTTDGSDPRTSPAKKLYTDGIGLSGISLLKAYSQFGTNTASASAVNTFRYIVKGTQDRVVPVTEDVYVDGTVPDTNRGTEPLLFMKALKNREAYLKFDLSKVDAGTQKVYLNLYGQTYDSSQAPARLKLYGVDSSWSEGTMTYNTKPLPTPAPAGAEIGEAVWPYEPSGWMSIDITGYIKGQKALGKTTASVGIVNTTDGAAYVNAKEAGGNAPYLLLVQGQPGTGPGEEPVNLPGLVDPLDTFEHVMARTNMRTEGADAQYLGGDLKRATRSTTALGSLTYKTAYDIQSFAIHSYFFMGVAVDPLKVYASPNGTSFTEVVLQPYKSGAPVSNWQMFVYEAKGLPAGTRYLKIEVKGDVKAWTPQIGKVILNKNVMSVLAVPDHGTVVGQPISVTLSTPTSGAQIFYKLNAETEARPYTGAISVQDSTTLHAFAIKNGLEASAPRSYVYRSKADWVVDKYGQMNSADFPEKVKTDDELRADLAADKAYYDGLQAPNWDAYGGLVGSKETYGLQAKGYYNVQTAADGRKILVTPLGTAFFSVGINGISPNDTYTMVTGREEIFEWLPDYANTEYKSAFMGTKDYFSYYLANYIKKTGTPYTSEAFYQTSWARMKKWGFNSAGGWSPTPLSEQFKVPYFPFLPLGSLEWAKIEGVKIFDIFADGAEAKLEAALEPVLTPNKNNPLIVGYFLGNENHYQKIAPEIPKLKGSVVAAKRRLVQMLQEKYGTIEAFNTAWNGTYGSFAELNDAVLYVDSQQAQYDVDDFVKLYLDTYYGTIARVFRKYDPNHLLLGDRWLTIPMNNAKLRGFMAEAAGRHMDVISMNHYAKNLNVTMLGEVHAKSGGKPLILTENGFGTMEQGLGSPLLVADQNERQLRYRTYVEGAASLGYVVGAHWFTYLDQAATGRWSEADDGEHYNFGLVNVADRPYKTFLQGVMATNHDIYSVMLGRKEPFRYDFGDAPRQPGNNTMAIPYTPVPVPIDGEVNGFPAGAPKFVLDEAQRVVGTDGAGMSGEYTLAWDNANLYVTASITDPTPMRNQYTDMNVWRGDGVELFFGPGDLTTPGDPLFNDRQLIMSAQPTAEGQPFWYWFNTSRQKAVNMAVKARSGGYVIEAAIPWETVNMQAAEGLQFLFDLGFDDSEDGENRKRQWMWNGTNTNSTERSNWGKATLVKP